MRSRKWLLAAGLLVALLLLGASWVVWQAWQVNQDLAAAVDDTAGLQSAVSSGDEQAADAALARLQQHSASAAERTNTRTWRLLGHLPLVGDDAAGVRLVSDVVWDLSRDGLEPLVRTAKDLESLLPKDARISIDAIESLQRPVAAGKAAFADADARLSAEDPRNYADRLKTNYRDLAGRVSDAAAVLNTADTALSVMPGMLGSDGPRNYLLVFQNNAEIRATGGLPGAVSLVHAQGGQVRMSRQVAANSFGETAEPVLPLTSAEKEIYNDQLGTYFLDANFTPDFPRTADLMRARWEQVYPERVDGVLSIDPVALSYILKATGPVSIGDTSLTSGNAVDELLHEVYLRYPNPVDQDAWFRLVSRSVFDKVSSGAESPEDLIKALVLAADERRLYVHSFHQTEQTELSGSNVAGELITDPKSQPQVGVYLNDATGAKMSYFLRYNVRVDATYCRGGVQGLSAKAHLLSDAPADAHELPDYVTGAGHFGTKPGSQVVLVRLFAPVGGDISKLQLNGEPQEFEPVVQNGREVVTAVVFLEPGFTVDLTWRMTTGEGQLGDTHVSVTPSVVTKQSSSITRSACS